MGKSLVIVWSISVEEVSAPQVGLVMIGKKTLARQNVDHILLRNYGMV